MDVDINGERNIKTCASKEKTVVREERLCSLVLKVVRKYVEPAVCMRRV